LFDSIFHAPDAFALSTPEEIELIQRRFGFTPKGDVVGIGVTIGPADASRFERAYGLEGLPYPLYVGRIDNGKGVGELLDFFAEYKRRHPTDPVHLVMIGDGPIDVSPFRDVIATGFVDYQTRDDALAGMLALAQPSFFESFSMILTEAF